MSSYTVTASTLNLRSEPSVAPKNRLATLPQGQKVEKLGVHSTQTDWWQVSTMLNGVSVTGYVNSQYLAPEGAPDNLPAATSISPAHLTPKHPILRSAAEGRAFPLNENGMPSRAQGSATEKVRDLHRIIEWLGVASNPRYTKSKSETYCNIYAYDFCCLAGVYLPRVWWTRKAIAELAKGNPVAVQYEKTVSELSANSLNNWFEEFGSDFGWTRSFDINEVQEAANAGSVCFISGQRVDLNQSGHICAVVPETDDHRAQRKNGVVVTPLQSQAGSNNFSYGGVVWWTASKFRRFSFWIHP
ncbi:SH3 domain-containing protein [Pseudomonas sp. B21-040]|jgi:hypothetical protein|uniref:SH3 domain-containing protein n=1 Tax=unclassified Pseudomonas TaxID=196821 RepID=UPI0009856F89|nr:MULTISPECIES: SH3 domain-containing protein [unclassified Pseudomonas]PWK29555.1 SH3 domain-containing protein [Pseudomonas sp. OV226]UVL42707.1 SH3 domain-containing protein [Pseudomonas sp. B21-040]